ncbi:MAG: cytochrome c oxidase subunit II, partial [Gemmatimonadota bacterium]|nr:cytochrome c oxidase subunit II [Gemmatimonadota bacterium]
MNVNYYEKLWMWAAVVMIALFLGATVFATVSQGRTPPSHVEMIDPQNVFGDERFATQGVFEMEDGTLEVRIVAMTFTFLPREIRVPANRPVTFRMTSTDVMHGFHIIGTNGNTMVAPGYVSQFTMTFDEPGEYLVLCNEYCGLAHHEMYATLTV